MTLVVGLGNVGTVYEHTRHNVGFEVVDALRRAHHASAWEPAASRYAHCTMRVKGTAVRLMKPLTMMNRSGDALRASVRRWRVTPEDILLVCDDVNLPLGALRLRPQGSDGGHHGLASCVEALGTQDVARLRIGIGIQPLPRDLTDFVLSPFDGKEHPLLEQALARAAEACELWATEGVAAAMNWANRPQP